ncbi:MAG: outer membrane lipid asymmetry maintenance protein MlaD [Rhodospirillaceae bacterium]|nr:outer membrane lipid asymmetry maintenance protein MlaD [Rhodospirillaceae bacterium]
MTKAESRETFVGVAALLVAVLGLTLTALGNRSDNRAQNAAATYVVEFTHADGLHLGAPVRMAGIKIGSISAVALDDRYRAVMTLELNQDIPLPDDSAALIETDGVFGTKYIELQPGGSTENLKSGARIAYTQDSIIIEDLITKIVEQAKATTKRANDAQPQ